MISSKVFFSASYIKNNLSFDIQEKTDKSKSKLKWKKNEICENLFEILERSSRKSVKLKKINFSSLSFEDQNNLVETVKGGRKNRDYIIETYTAKESS